MFVYPNISTGCRYKASGRCGKPIILQGNSILDSDFLFTPSPGHLPTLYSTPFHSLLVLLFLLLMLEVELHIDESIPHDNLPLRDSQYNIVYKI